MLDVPSDASCTAPIVVVVVESDPYIRALQNALLGTRYAPQFFADGEEALAAVRRLRPKLMIADILVPKIDGLRLCKLIKDAPETRGIRVLIFTELLAERRAREAGADAFLRKPIEQTRFLDEVQRLLSEGEHGSHH